MTNFKDFFLGCAVGVGICGAVYGIAKVVRWTIRKLDSKYIPVDKVSQDSQLFL
ncbi:MAG: hypothetical protein LUI14_14490 [Lachnospiraceae bacterium]|nr:hypothetical protein [Lachnospiraceae bacterium]